MSERDPDEHPKTYERFCRPRFEKLEDDIKDVANCAGRLEAIVTDGLKENVQDLKDGQKWLFRLVVGILITVALGAAGLYWSVTQKVQSINTAVERIENGSK